MSSLNFKVWCSTPQEIKEVAEALAAQGVTGKHSGEPPTDVIKYGKDHLGFIVEYGRFRYANNRDTFDDFRGLSELTPDLYVALVSGGAVQHQSPEPHEITITDFTSAASKAGYNVRHEKRSGDEVAVFATVNDEDMFYVNFTEQIIGADEYMLFGSYLNFAEFFTLKADSAENLVAEVIDAVGTMLEFEKCLLSDYIDILDKRTKGGKDIELPFN